jgi:hypothetical protein
LFLEPPFYRSKICLNLSKRNTSKTFFCTMPFYKNRLERVQASSRFLKGIMKTNLKKYVVQTTIALFAGLAMVSCNQTTSTALPWTRDEVEAVFDLTELGQSSTNLEGNWMLGGRVLDPSFVTTQTYGRRVNLLGLDDAAYNAMTPSVAQSIFFATPAQLRAAMQKNQITMGEVRAMQADGKITRDEFIVTAQRVADRSGNPRLLQQIGLEGGR